MDGGNKINRQKLTSDWLGPGVRGIGAETCHNLFLPLLPGAWNGLPGADWVDGLQAVQVKNSGEIFSWIFDLDTVQGEL